MLGCKMPGTSEGLTRIVGFLRSSTFFSILGLGHAIAIQCIHFTVALGCLSARLITHLIIQSSTTYYSSVRLDELGKAFQGCLNMPHICIICVYICK